MERHTLGGRTFVAVREGTVEQDYTFLGLIREAGIPELTIDPDEGADEFARRILDKLVENGAVLKLLGCLLVPEELVGGRRSRFHLGRRPDPGEVWTPEIGEETAAFLARLRERDDKLKIQGLVLTLLVSFFESGIVSLWTTEISSDETIPDQTGEESPSSISGTTPTEDRYPRTVSDLGRRSSSSSPAGS